MKKQIRVVIGIVVITILIAATAPTIMTSLASHDDGTEEWVDTGWGDDLQIDGPIEYSYLDVGESDYIHKDIKDDDTQNISVEFTEVRDSYTTDYDGDLNQTTRLWNITLEITDEDHGVTEVIEYDNINLASNYFYLPDSFDIVDDDKYQPKIIIKGDDAENTNLTSIGVDFTYGGVMDVDTDEGVYDHDHSDHTVEIYEINDTYIDWELRYDGVVLDNHSGLYLDNGDPLLVLIFNNDDNRVDLSRAYGSYIGDGENNYHLDLTMVYQPKSEYLVTSDDSNTIINNLMSMVGLAILLVIVIIALGMGVSETKYKTRGGYNRFR